MPDGGTLTLIGRADGGSVCLDVIDTGCGMTPDVLANLFQPFHTTKKTGTGLGLPTARKVVVAHGGSLDVQSEPGRGTKFTVRLPAASDPPG
jgi:signal transduction histidine kinase